MLDFDREGALPVLYGILERYTDSSKPGEQRIAEAVQELIAELEGEDAKPDSE